MQTEVDVTGDREPIDRIADEFLARYRGGERPAISEYTAAHPELAAEIRELFPTLVVLERLGPRPEEILEQSGVLIADAAAPQQLGDYRILREVGRGGMGVVYEAVQESLGRHVALKVLPSRALLDAVRLKRFQHEAQAAAKLHHTNIVPVFGVGTAEGVHFYAMQYIPGRGLNEVIDEVRRLKAAGASGLSPADREPLPGHDDTPPAANLSTISDTPRYYRSVAQLGAQVADALAHAHRQGVLHRDIKPANLLLDAGGTVWVTDFGLAKAEGMEELTQPGDVIGTLRYTAPEQLRGDSDARSDIYSLGVTLYELFTLRPAFDAIDRITLLRQIAQEEPPRPRKLDRRIPRDLETIVLKAITKEPARRYATADDMAEDLRGFLGDRPIKARPTPWWEHMGRWCRRNPAIATACSVAVAALVGGFAVSLWQWDRANRNYVQAQSSSAQASASARQAAAKAEQSERDFRLAYQAVDQMLSRAGFETLESVPHMERSRRDLLEDAIRFYEKLLAGHSRRPELRMEMARAQRRLGDIHVWLGDYEAAEREFQRGLELGEELLKDDPKNSAYGNLVAEACFFLGTVRAHRGQAPQAEHDLNQALARWESMEPASPGNVVAQARVLHQLGLLFRRDGRRDEEDQCLRQALARLESLSSRNLATPSHRLLLADVLHSLGKSCDHRGRADEGEQHLRRAADLIVKEYRENPVPSVHIRLATAYSNLAQNLSHKDPTKKEAGIYYAKSILISERLVEEFPRAWPCQIELAAASDSYGHWLLSQRRTDEAVSAHRRAVKLWLSLLARDASNIDYRRRLATARHKLAMALRAGGDLAGAKASLLAAIKDEESVLQASPGDAKAIEFLQQHGTLLVRLLREMNDAEAVELALARQLALFDKLAAAAQPATRELRLAVWRSRRQLGQFLSQQRRLDEAEVLFRKSVEEARAVQAGGEPAYRSELAKALNELSRIRFRQGRFAEAVPPLEDAIALQQTAAADGPDDRIERKLLYGYHDLLSDLYILEGDYQRAAHLADHVDREFADILSPLRWASVWARCCPLAANDASLDEEERQALLRAFGDKALALLRTAQQQKRAELADLATRREFVPLHERQDFRELLSTLGQQLP